jgi:hypothetical protein
MWRLNAIEFTPAAIGGHPHGLQAVLLRRVSKKVESWLLKAVNFVSASPMRDLTDARWIYFKAVLFLLIGCGAAALLIVECPTLRTALLLSLVIWSFCRCYYFAFYVIERYVDPSYRFSGLLSFALYLFSRRSGRSNPRDTAHK